MLVERAATHIEEAKEQQKFYADKGRRNQEFNIGDKVWIFTRFMAACGAPKFQYKFIGPFKILQKIGKAAYKVDLPQSMLMHLVFHVSFLTADKPRPGKFASMPSWQQCGDRNEEARFEIEHIY